MQNNIQRGLLSLLWPLALFQSPAFAQTPPIDAEWLPVTAAERQVTTPAVDVNAGVEALFWRVHVMDEFPGNQDIQRVLYHYIRLKIFSEKGKEAAATIDIPLRRANLHPLTSSSAVPSSADGTVVELKKDSVYERDVVRAGGRKRKVKSFAMPVWNLARSSSIAGRKCSSTRR